MHFNKHENEFIITIFSQGDLFAGALFIQKAVGETSPRVLYTSVVILLLIAGLFTIMGGLTAVMWTDFVQTILIIGGAFVLMIYCNAFQLKNDVDCLRL